MTQAQALVQSGFSIDNLDDAANSAATFRVAVIVDADGEDKSGFVIVGKNSPEYQAAARAIRIDGLKRSSKRKSALDTSTDEGAGVVAKAIDANELTLAASVVVDWFGFASNGASAAYSKETAAKLLAKYPTWREKITAALDVDANFIKG